MKLRQVLFGASCGMAGAALGFLLSGSIGVVIDTPREAVPVLRKHVESISDEALFTHACPGAVSFCKEWREKWAWQAAPEVKNQTVRECVVDFMSSVMGRSWPPGECPR